MQEMQNPWKNLNSNPEELYENFINISSAPDVLFQIEIKIY